MKFNLNAAGLLVIAGLIGIGIGPTSAWAADQSDELIVELRGSASYATSDSVDAISNNGVMGGLSLGLGYDLSNLVLPGLRSYVLFDAMGESQSRFDGDLSLDWSRQVYMLGVDYGPDLWGFFRPSVRIGAGYATQALEMRPGGSSGRTKYNDRTHDVVATGAVGLELYIPFSDKSGSIFNAFTVGLGGHFGYMLQTAATFDELETSDDSWQREPLNFGELDVDGLYWNLGLTLRIKI